MTNGKKRLYLGLLGITLLILGLVLIYAWVTVFQRDVLLLRYLFAVVTGGVVTVLFIIMLGFFGIVLSVMSSRTIGILNRPINFTVTILYPVVIRLGKMFKIAQERIQISFVEVNNQLVKAKMGKVRPHKLLVLLPHCLQSHQCSKRITINQLNCMRCGKCTVGDLLKLCEKYGVHIRIATGGTLARAAIKAIKPEAVVAVACERDLTSGIIDCIPLPVLGVPNDRPHGPCFDTGVRLQRVEKALLFLLKGEDENVFLPSAT